MHHSLLPDIGISIIFSALIGVLVYRLKQPTILGYFIAGAILGPGVGFGLVSDPESIEVISEIGLILLLFVIGLEMNLGELASAGKQLAVAGFGQFLLCAAFGFAVFSYVSIPGSEGWIGALYVALLCALSSTAVVVKLLSDKFELDSRAGRLTVGVLVIQDLWAILVLAFQPNLASPQLGLIGVALAKSGALIAFGYFFSKWILAPVLKRATMSPEVVMLISLGWCAGMAQLAGYYGLSKEMGALIAGASVSAFPFRVHVIAKTLPLRDFFLTLFFVSLGMKIVAPQSQILIGALVLIGFVILSRFLSVYPLVRWSGGGPRTAFLTSLNLAQIGEFSLVIAALGVSFGHVGEAFMATMIYAMAASAVLSSYLIKYNSQIFDRVAPAVAHSSQLLESSEDENSANTHQRDIVILGYHHCGRELVNELATKNPKLLPRLQVLDFNLEALRELKTLSVKGVFADLASFDTLEHLHLEHARVILMTLPDMLLKGTSNMRVTGICRALAQHATIIAMADNEDHRTMLISAGADEAVLWYRSQSAALASFLSQPETTSLAC